MLAKDIKIHTLKRQRKFIEKELLKVMTCREDADIVYYYKGDLYPEVKEYFENEGFNVERLERPGGLGAIFSNNRPIYVFTLSDIALTEEEMKVAEEYEPEEKNDEDGQTEESDDHEAGAEKVVPNIGDAIIQFLTESQ